MRIAHLNAAGAALPSASALDAMARHGREETRIGPHWAAAEAAGALAEARAAAARLLGVPGPEHVAFGETATRLWASALGALPLGPGQRILLARAEWGGNVLNALRLAEVRGATCEVLPSDAAGRVEPQAVAERLDERVAAICIPAASSALGLRQPVGAIGALPRPEGCLFFVDGAQSLGAAPGDLAGWRADVVTAPARKWLRGPRGQALMGLSGAALRRLGNPPLLDQAATPWIADRGWGRRDDAARFESFEFSVAGRLGFGAALAEAAPAMAAAAIAGHLGAIAAALRAWPGVAVFEDAADQSAFLTFRTGFESPEALVRRAMRAGVAISLVGLGYARWELTARGLDAVCRVSPHAYTTEEEVARFLGVIEDSARSAGEPLSPA